MNCSLLAICLLGVGLLNFDPVTARKHNCTAPKATKYYLYEVFTAADVVITGTIKAIVLDSKNHRINEATVRVRRIYKGKEYLDNSPRSIVVRGIADTQPCAHRVHLGSTRIFALSATEDAFFLNVPLVRLNLLTLDALHYTSFNRAHKKRRKTKQLHCETFLCGFGQKCNYKTGQCECRTRCPEIGSPVCGSDNNTYSSFCHLSIKACILEKRGIKLRRTECQKRNPCESLRCGPGETCVVEEDKGLLRAKCNCPTSCPNYGDSVESSPVCSNLGEDFPSACQLQRAACETKKNITIKYHGKCDPCDGKVCPFGLSCIVDEFRKPVCRCSQQCPLTYEPVCGTDGKSYPNACLMKMSACRENRDVDVYHQGPCNDKKNPCTAKKCRPPSHCKVVNENKAECQCRDKCPLIVKPVCGTNGKTYESECHLERESCITNSTIGIKHTGACGIGLCANDDACLPPKVCAIIDGRQTCVCPLCEEHELKEVCASDGFTYQNECRMKQTACAKNISLFTKYRGVCAGCESMKCEFYASCKSDSLHPPKCSCPECPPVHASEGGISEKQPVCGTDSVTYSSECHLRRRSCLQQKFIVVAFQGNCDACHTIECPYGEECRGGVCIRPADEEQTKSSPQTVFDASTMAPCLFGAFRSRSKSHCICPSCDDSRRVALICGSDHNIYANQCELNTVSCREQREIFVEPLMTFCTNISGHCQCNKLGSYGPDCDTNGQCKCRAGVGGKKCDSCQPGFWGLHLIARGDALSCTPCGCSAFGSARPDCDQMTGRCECKPNVIGKRCDKCPIDLALTEAGCQSPLEYISPRNCITKRCHHGARCIMSAGHPTCVCPKHCELGELGTAGNMTVCGSDNVRYSNICELQMTACKLQTDTVPIAFGSCVEGGDDDDEATSDRLERNENAERKLGSPCRRNAECRQLNAICRSSPGRRGVCECEEGKKSVAGVCITDQQQSSSILNVPLHFRTDVSTELGGITTKSSLLIKYTSNQQDYVILYGKGERGEEFTLLARAGQIFVRIGNSTLESLDRVRGFVEIQLTWDGSNNLNLNVNGEERRKKMIVRGEKIATLYIGNDKKMTSARLVGAIEELEIDGQKVRYRDLIIKDSPPSHLRTVNFPGTGGYLAFTNYSADIRVVARINLVFKNTNSNGLLFYWGSTTVASSDFLSISIANFQPLVLWNLGAGVSSLTGSKLIDGKWNSVQFTLSSRNGTLNVNNEPAVSEELMPGGVHLDVSGETVFIGGVNQDATLPNRVRQLRDDHFTGQLALASINETPLNVDEATVVGDVEWASDDEQCDDCEHGFCVRDFDRNICSPEKSIQSAAYFDGHFEYAYLNSGNRTLTASNTSDLSFEFRTSSQSGTLWHESAWSLKESGDFLVVFIQDGILHIGMNLGNDLDLKPVSSNITVDDEEWHAVSIRRKERRCILSVDGRRVLSIVSTPGSTQLNTNGLAYIGGREQTMLPLQSPFVGCMRKVKIRGYKLNLLSETLSLRHPSVCT